jgi:toxin ParE1/3/4
MPIKYTLRYLPAAQDDLLSILDFIARDSAGRALSFVERLEASIGSLEGQPLLGHVPRNPRLRESGYRILVIESYLAFYIIRADDIEVHRIIHGSRDLDHLV